MRREQGAAARAVRFTIGDTEIETVREFKYLGRITSDDDDDLPAVRENMKKARKRWARVSRVLTRNGASPKMMGKFYTAVLVRSVLLYGSETWVLSEKMKSDIPKMPSFHTYSEQCKPAYLVATRRKSLTL
jgi:hypothetical protein